MQTKLVRAEYLQAGDQIVHGLRDRQYVIVSVAIGCCAVVGEEYAVERVRVKMNEAGKPQGKYGPHASVGFTRAELVEVVEREW